MNLKQFLKPSIYKISLSLPVFIIISLVFDTLFTFELSSPIIPISIYIFWVIGLAIEIVGSYLIACFLATKTEKIIGIETTKKSFFALDQRKISLTIFLFIFFPFFSLLSSGYFFQLIPFALPLYWPLIILNFFEYSGQPFWMWVIDLFILLSPLLLYLFACLIVWAWDKYFSQRNRFQKFVVIFFSLIIVTCGFFLWNLIMVHPVGKSYDAIIKSNMDMLRVDAEFYYDNNLPNGYIGLNCDYEYVSMRCTAIANYVKRPTIWVTKDKYCAYTNLKVAKNHYYCVDSNGTAIETSINPGSSNYCDGITFVCPSAK